VCFLVQHRSCIAETVADGEYICKDCA